MVIVMSGLWTGPRKSGSKNPDHVIYLDRSGLSVQSGQPWMSLSHTKEWEYMEEVLIVLETESTVDITMSRMITQLFHRIGMNLLFHQCGCYG